MPKISMSLQCLREELSGTDGAKFPLYTGFSTPSQLKMLAVAPSYETGTSHSDIASDVLGTPVKRWQRPVDKERTARIANVFNDRSKIMPNPVLIAENLTGPIKPKITPVTTESGELTRVFEITWTFDPDDRDNLPLWILDGQHRIGGLASSDRRDDPLPLVLLLKRNANSYGPAHFAEIFAQVTAEAEDLKPEHREWLSYAFNLREYRSSNPTSDKSKKAFKVATRLCSVAPRPAQPRPFFNGIKFNPFSETTAVSGGFGQPCQDFGQIILKNYYLAELGAASGYLDPKDLADALGEFYLALTTAVVTPDQSVFFSSKKNHGQKIMQNAVIVGALSYLLEHPRPGSAADWTDVLDQLKFKATDWDFTSWANDLSGSAAKDSRIAASKTMAYFFRTLELPVGTNIQEFLNANDARFQVTSFGQTPKGRKSRRGSVPREYPTTGSKNFVVAATHRFIEISVPESSPNIARITLSINTERLKSARTIDLNTFKHPFQLQVRSHFYGGNEDVHTLDIK